jgi:hypothetical protein
LVSPAARSASTPALESNLEPPIPLPGRLAFILGGSLFGVVFFRHLPEIHQGADLWLMFRRGLQLVASLFALFCVTLELERLGRALGGSQ